MASDERRKYFRLTEEDIICYSVIPNYKTKRMISEDLSLGGIRFLSENFIALKSCLKIQLKLPSVPKIIDAIVIVRWLKLIYDDERYEVGAEFLHIKEEDLRFLSRYLKEKR